MNRVFVTLVTIFVICFLKYETQGTFDKVCHYSCGADPYAIVIEAWGICPATIETDDCVNECS